MFEIRSNDGTMDEKIAQCAAACETQVNVGCCQFDVHSLACEAFAATSPPATTESGPSTSAAAVCGDGSRWQTTAAPPEPTTTATKPKPDDGNKELDGQTQNSDGISTFVESGGMLYVLVGLGVGILVCGVVVVRMVRRKHGRASIREISSRLQGHDTASSVDRADFVRSDLVLHKDTPMLKAWERQPTQFIKPNGGMPDQGLGTDTDDFLWWDELSKTGRVRRKGVDHNSKVRDDLTTAASSSQHLTRMTKIDMTSLFPAPPVDGSNDYGEWDVMSEGTSISTRFIPHKSVTEV
jgi:hypothetical protein